MEVYSCPTDASNSNNRTSLGERINVISVSRFLFRTLAYIRLHLVPFVPFLSVKCNYTCTFQCECSVCLALTLFSFVHQSKGCESPLRLSFKPSAFRIGLKPLTPFYQALYSWDNLVTGILRICPQYIRYLHYMYIYMDFSKR